MKIEELASTLKPKADAPPVPITRQDRLLGPVPFSICFPHTNRHTQAALDEALEGMDWEARLDTLSYNPSSRRFHRQHGARHDAHLGGVEL